MGTPRPALTLAGFSAGDEEQRKENHRCAIQAMQQQPSRIDLVRAVLASDMVVDMQRAGLFVDHDREMSFGDICKLHLSARVNNPAMQSAAQLVDDAVDVLKRAGASIAEIDDITDRVMPEVLGERVASPPSVFLTIRSCADE
jgi:poly-gamma-glutamate capsule biosynthesis protein CapA/YwtB (metallophosphatase superfamily)